MRPAGVVFITPDFDLVISFKAQKFSNSLKAFIFGSTNSLRTGIVQTSYVNKRPSRSKNRRIKLGPRYVEYFKRSTILVFRNQNQ